MFALTLTTVSMFAQSNHYYYYKRGKVFLNLEKSSLYINTDNTFQKSSVDSQNLLDYTLKTENNPINGETNKWSIIDFATQPTDIKYYQKINTIKSVSTVNVVAPSFTTMTGKKIVLSKHFYVKLKQASDLNLLEQRANEYNVTIKNQNQFMPLWYTLVCTKNTIGNSLEVANAFYETGLFASSSPNFISIRDEEATPTTQTIVNGPVNGCVNDQYFGQQWNLDNTGQLVSNNPNILATPDIDINACEAWNISTGDSNITIAVLDSGVQLNHPDLTNMHPLNYNTPSDPSLLWPHGTACAGIIGATQNNFTGLSGVSPDCQIMSLNISFTDADDIADAVNFAWQNGADILNNSWKVFMSLTEQDIINDAYNNALTLGRNGKGCVVVFTSGNNDELITEYPANSNEDFLVVGAMSPCGERKSPTSCDLDNLNTTYGSSYGDELDIMAPGVFIPTTDITGGNGWNTDSNGDYMDFKDTSAAAPHVSAVAGLILSVNPNLTNIEVNNIIESTAQKVNEDTLYTYEIHPGRDFGTWNNEMGYGLVDAHAAVILAQSMNTNTVDLYTKDTPIDFGIEPNINPNSTFLSQDIWVRHEQDGLTNFIHQTPIINTNNYVYVKVRNNGAVASSGNDQLNLYWSTWGTIWPNHWIDHYGDAFWNQVPDLYGDELGSLTIPPIEPGQETILEFNMDFNPPFHGLYGRFYKLLTRIISTQDPIQNETSNIHNNILNNNNIASKNIWVSNDNESYYRTVSTVYNPTDSTKTYSLELSVDEHEFGKAIYNEAEIHIDLEPELYNAWNNGGKQGNNFKITKEENIIIAINNNMTLSNIALQPNQLYSFNATFHFLTKELTDKEEFNYVVKQFDAENGELVDIVPIKIQKESRPLFLANAGDDLEIDKNETITISAEQINEAAVYNWYDHDGNLVYTGKELTVSADVTKKFKLEIVADSDGFKDYDEVDVTVNQFYLKTIVPNPATDNVVVNYKTIDVTSAYLMIIGTNTNTSNNYIINTNQEQVSINISNYPIGYYTVALVCNGTIVDAKTLIKN